MEDVQSYSLLKILTYRPPPKKVKTQLYDTKKIQKMMYGVRYKDPMDVWLCVKPSDNLLRK